MGLARRSQHPPEANLWDHVMGVVVDPYVVLYLVVPFAMIVAYRRSEALARDEVRLRCGTGVAWLARVGLDAGAAACSMALALLLATVATGWGLPLQHGWSPVLLEKTGPLAMSPYAISGGGLVAWVLGVATVMVIVVAARVRSSTWALCAGPAVWSALLVSFRVDSSWGLLSFPFRLPGIWARGSFWAGAVGACLALLMLVGVAALLSGAVRLGPLLRSPQMHRAGGALAIVAATLVMTLLNRQPDETWVEGMWRVFYGGSAERPLSLPAMYWMVVFLGVVYGFLVRLDRQLQMEFAQWAVRYGSARQWWRRHLPGWFLGAAAWPAVAVATAAVALAAVHGPPTPDVTVALTVWQVVVGNVLQVMVCVLVVALARWLSGRSEGGLVALAVVVVLSAFRVPPFGLSAASWLVDDPTAATWTTATLVVTVVALTWFALLIVDRKGSP